MSRMPPLPVSMTAVPPLAAVRLERVMSWPAAPPVAMVPRKVLVPAVLAVKPAVKVMESVLASPIVSPAVFVKPTAAVTVPPALMAIE